MVAAGHKSRLSKAAEFDQVYRHGRSAQHRLMVLYCFERPENTMTTNTATHGPRIGLTVSKKVGGAVERNHLKRQLRELLRAKTANLTPDSDYVLVARPGLNAFVKQQGISGLENIITELLAKVHVNHTK